MQVFTFCTSTWITYYGQQKKSKEFFILRHHSRACSDEFRLLLVWNHVCQDGHFFQNNYGFNRPYFANSYSTHFPVLTDPRQLVHLPGIRVVTHVVARDEIGPKRTNDFSLGHSERWQFIARKTVVPLTQTDYSITAYL